uniref:Uncharacterized protein n=1 Tax=Paramormyrops kingsleyae TaxID=1676925 RepID=A0A3B3SXD3_9TELE
MEHKNSSLGSWYWVQKLPPAITMCLRMSRFWCHSVPSRAWVTLTSLASAEQPLKYLLSSSYLLCHLFLHFSIHSVYRSLDSIVH